MKKLFLILLFLSACSSMGKLTLKEENDFFAPTNRDKHYTQGLRLQYRDGNEAYSLGQTFYTPESKRVATPILDDRPYAGWLYGGYDRYFETLNNGIWQVGGRLGVVGPSALGYETQKWFHELLDQRVPLGWDNQLHDELGVILQAINTKRVYFVNLFDDINLDILTNGGIYVGNVITQFTGEPTLRIGHNLVYSPIDTPNVLFKSKLPIRDDDSIYYVYLSPRIRSVFHNIFLDGNTWKDSQSVDRNVMVYEMNIGFHIEYDSYIFGYGYGIGTKEFKTQKSIDNFGAITFGYRW